MTTFFHRIILLFLQLVYIRALRLDFKRPAGGGTSLWRLWSSPPDCRRPRVFVVEISLAWSIAPIVVCRYGDILLCCPVVHFVLLIRAVQIKHGKNQTHATESWDQLDQIFERFAALHSAISRRDETIIYFRYSAIADHSNGYSIADAGVIQMPRKIFWKIGRTQSNEAYCGGGFTQRWFLSLNRAFDFSASPAGRPYRRRDRSRAVWRPARRRSPTQDAADGCLQSSRADNVMPRARNSLTNRAAVFRQQARPARGAQLRGKSGNAPNARQARRSIYDSCRHGRGAKGTSSIDPADRHRVTPRRYGSPSRNARVGDSVVRGRLPGAAGWFRPAEHLRARAGRSQARGSREDCSQPPVRHF
jgi:hypothetical protein